MPKGLKKRNSKKAGVFAAVRFLGAFRKSPVGFWDSLSWEISANCPERAAMPLRVEAQDYYNLAGVGVLFASADVKRVFSADCWSALKDSGELYATRNIKGRMPETGAGKHEECFIKAGATAIAIVADWSKIRNSNITSGLKRFAAENGLEVVDCNKKAIRAFLNVRKGGRL